MEKPRRSGALLFPCEATPATSAPNFCPNKRSSSSSASSSGRLPAHPEPPLPRAPVEVVPLAAAHGRYAKTFRELLLSPQLLVAMGGLGCRTHRVAPLSQGRENPDGLSRALRPGVAVGEELPSLDGFRARSMRRLQCSPDGVLETEKENGRPREPSRRGLSMRSVKEEDRPLDSIEAWANDSRRAAAQT
jgi:hypothetical protein